jgi:hypothetical protein
MAWTTTTPSSWWRDLWFSSTWLQHSSLKYNSGVLTGNKAHKNYFGVWTLSGSRVWFCWAKLTWEGWLSLRRFWTKNSSTQTKRWESCLPAEDEHQGVHFIGEAGRPGPTVLGCLWPALARFFLSMMISTLWLSCLRVPQVAPPKLSHPLLWLHYWSFHLMPLLWVMSMLPRFTCRHEFPAKHCLLPPYAFPLHVTLMKVVERASRDASWWMHDLFN